MYNSGFNQNQGLPVPCNQIDQSTFSNNLPQGNDRVPQVQLSQWMQANQQVGLVAIGLFRSVAQSVSNKSPLHCFVYNLLSQNGFNNSVWQQWCQMAVDFTEFLVVVKGYNPNDAVSQASNRLFEACLGVAFHTYPQLQQVTPNTMWAGLQTAQTIYQSITNDIKAFRSGAMNNMGYQNNNHGNLPPINMGGGYNQPQNNMSNAQVSGYSNMGAVNNVPMNHNSNNSNTVASSLYDIPVNEPAKPLNPVEEISTDYFGQPTPSEQKPMQSFPQANTSPEPQATDLPVPSNVDQVVIDPTYYQPQGFKLDITRPYDVIHNPGGVLIKPAQLSDWELTVGDDAPWPQLLDPNHWCVFHVRFPDGVVKEKSAEWNSSMDYLRHELDAELRRKAHRPKGIVVASAVPISTIGGEAAKAEEIEDMVKDGHLKRDTVPPTVLAPVFQGSNDLEIEMTIREEMSNLLDCNFNGDIPMPAVEYKSTFHHPISLTQEAFEEINKLIETKDLIQVAQGLRDLTLRGQMPIRTLRALNDRLTKAVNGVLADSMCLTIAIDDFCEDYVGLEDYIAGKRGTNMQKVLKGAAENILNRALTIVTVSVEDDDQALYSVVDNYLNHQVGWTLADIATLNLQSGKATLISTLSHPVILDTLRGMIKRANAEKDIFVGTPRLITSDGYYLEAIKGRLVEGATLLKLVK